MRLPGHQVSKSKAWPTELRIEPETKIMQRDLGRQARLKSAKVMGPFALEAAGRPELLLHGRHDLAYSCPPTSEPLGPWRSALALRWAENLGAIGLPPGLLVGVPVVRNYLIPASFLGLLSPADLALSYKQLPRVEEAWRTRKSSLRVRPV